MMLKPAREVEARRENVSPTCNVVQLIIVAFIGTAINYYATVRGIEALLFELQLQNLREGGQ